MTDGSRTTLQESTLNALRIVAGFMFSLHGFQKIFGILGREEAVEIMSRMGAAGLIELVAGVAIMLGLFTKPLAFLASGEMAFAYFLAHFPRGLNPLENGGERAALYCFVFLMLFAFGPGKFSLDQVLFGKKGELPPVSTEGPDLAGG